MGSFFDFCAGLEKTKYKLESCLSVMYVMDAGMDASVIDQKALFGICCLLETVLKELETESEFAYNYIKKENTKEKDVA